MNSQREASASKNNNTERTVQSLSVTPNNRVDFLRVWHSLDAQYTLRCYFGRTHCVQNVHLIIFCPVAL